MLLFRGGISIVIKECISIHHENKNRTKEQATRCMTEIMTGEASPAQIGSFLVVLRKKGETVEEVTAFARVMREFSRRIHPRVGGLLVDTCGTGGDKIKTFNVSTTSAFVVAAAGIPVAKHGNRSFTSKCGSANLLELLGVCDLDLLEPMARAALNLGARSVMTVHGLDGVDEISLTGKTEILHATNGSFVLDEIEPEDLGFKRTQPRELGGSCPEENARLTSRILSGKMSRDDPRVQTVMANAAAAFILTEKAHDFSDGIEIASNIISEGAALGTLQDMVEFSGGSTQRIDSLA